MYRPIGKVDVSTCPKHPFDKHYDIVDANLYQKTARILIGYVCMCVLFAYNRLGVPEIHTNCASAQDSLRD